MKLPSLLLAASLCAGPAFLAPVAAQSIELISQTSLPGGAEILAYTKDGNTVASTEGNVGVQLYTLNADGTLTAREKLTFVNPFEITTIGAVSSVALDPRGRGFGVATIIPQDNDATPGRLIFFTYRAGSVAAFKTFTVGGHPDSVIFSRDGSKVFVANEGEFTTGGATDIPGSVSVLEIGVNATVQSITALENSLAVMRLITFEAANLAAGVTLNALRFNDNSPDAQANRFRHVEPEYITEGNGKIYVTLQENNAIAELSLTGADALKWTAIFPLGTIAQTIDASDRDGAEGTTAALIDDLVKGMPMPDTMASFTLGNTRYLLTANEGDFRVDDGDRVRVGDASFTGVEQGVTIDRSNAVLGRLRILRDVSDPDGDGLLDDVVMPGTRSFSIWNAATGAFVGDTGSLEAKLLELAPTLHNINGESGTGTFDARSPDKGPEPEALATGQINGHQYAFVGLERQGGIMMFDVDQPSAPEFSAYINNIGNGFQAPESIVFVPAADNPTGDNLLLIGYEVSGTVGVYRATGAPAVVVPQPTISGRKIVRVGANERRVELKGTVSAGVTRVTLNGARARVSGTTWEGTVTLPAKKKNLRVRAIAFAGDVASKPLTIVVQRKKR